MLTVCGALFLKFVLPNYLCANDEVREFAAPGGGLKAVVFRRNCGATTSFSTHISILAGSKSLPNATGNIFTSDERLLDVRWLSDRELLVSLHGSERIYRQVQSFRSINIRYEPPNHAGNAEPSNPANTLHGR